MSAVGAHEGVPCAVMMLDWILKESSMELIEMIFSAYYDCWIAGKVFGPELSDIVYHRCV